jgi:Tfp pilus assembly protein PilO
MSTPVLITAVVAVFTLGYLNRIAKALETIARLTADDAAVRELERAQRDRLAEELRASSDELARRRDQ